MRQIFKRPESMTKTRLRYCAGCGHSIIHRLIAEVIDELGIRERVIGMSPVGCAVFSHEYFNFDMLEIAHGRCPAAATAMKRVLPDNIVFSYQGDGDMAAIGTAEIIHAANRGENICVFFVNNATYGMTGGQMAPTTLVAQKTTTSPRGRDLAVNGHPMRVAELLSSLDGVSYIARGSVDSYANIVKAKKMIRRAFDYQLNNKGFSFVEILSPCPTDWGLTPAEAITWLRGNMIPFFKQGTIKDRWKEE
jgi:2-oxoglutarate/2-oxoacid ferredoxin oxidoreductase subunit beta